jgi:hypothetical protein
VLHTLLSYSIAFLLPSDIYHVFVQNYIAIFAYLHYLEAT